MVTLLITVMTTAVFSIETDATGADEFQGLISDSESVSEGELRFLESTEEQPLTADVAISILPDSLDSGWVSIQQCYRNLDPVPLSEIRYRYGEMRGLRVIRSVQIDAVRVIDQAIELTSAERGAEICVAFSARILERSPGGYRLLNGPFHRQFLDGFYPMRVRMRVDFRDTGLQALIPGVRPDGLSIQQEPGALAIDVLFEGMLTIEVYWPVPDSGSRGPKASSYAS